MCVEAVIGLASPSGKFYTRTSAVRTAASIRTNSVVSSAAESGMIVGEGSPAPAEAMSRRAIKQVLQVDSAGSQTMKPIIAQELERIGALSPEPFEVTF